MSSRRRTLLCDDNRSDDPSLKRPSADRPWRHGNPFRITKVERSGNLLGQRCRWKDHGVARSAAEGPACALSPVRLHGWIDAGSCTESI